MSLAKPAIADMRFAVDTLNADAANITAPSSGQRDTGWNLNQVPPSSFFNYLSNRTYRWMLFLDEVFKTAGVAVADIKLTGAANITGVVTAGSGLVVSAGGAAVTGNSSVVGTLSVSALATLASATITGNAAVGGTLGVTGAVTIGGSLTASGGTLAVTGSETVSGTLGVTGATTLTGGIANNVSLAAGATAASGQDIKVQGTGRHKHGTDTRAVHGSAFQPITSSTTIDRTSNGCKFTGGTGVIAPVFIAQGRRITAARFFIHDNATGPSVLQCDLSRMDTTGALTGNISAGSSGSGADQTITVTPSSSNGNLNASTAHQLKVFYFSGSAQCTVYLVELDFDFL